MFAELVTKLFQKRSKESVTKRQLIKKKKMNKVNGTKMVNPSW